MKIRRDVYSQGIFCPEHERPDEAAISFFNHEITLWLYECMYVTLCMTRHFLSGSNCLSQSLFGISISISLALLFSLIQVKPAS